MADGKRHAAVGRAIISVATLMAVGVAAIPVVTEADEDVLATTIILSVSFVAGAVMGYVITPDIDHDWYTVEEQRIKHATNAAVLGLWKLFWLPFVMAKHRSRVTHSWPLATVLKLAWLLFWIAVAVAAISDVLDISVSQAARDAAPLIILSIIPFFAGWSVQDLVHLAMDGMIIKKKG